MSAAAQATHLQHCHPFTARFSPSPEIPEPHRRQFRVAHRVLDIPVAEISLQGSGVVPLVGKCVAAGMAEHVRMGLKAQLGLGCQPAGSCGRTHAVLKGAPRSDVNTKGDFGSCSR